jgi:hypothetical protein
MKRISGPDCAAGPVSTVAAEHSRIGQVMTHSRGPASHVAGGKAPQQDLADLQSVMRMLDDRVADIVAEIPHGKRPLVSNALLNLAIQCILMAEGPAATAAILQRLTDLIRAGETPQGDHAFRLNGFDS